jgi:hypothetical protein
MRDASSSTSLPKKKNRASQTTRKTHLRISEMLMKTSKKAKDLSRILNIMIMRFQVLCGFGGVREDAIDSVDGFEVVSASAMIKCPG